MDGVIPDIQIVSSWEEVAEDAEVLLLLVGHKQFVELHPALISQISQLKTVVDTTNMLNETEWKQAGFMFYRLGDGIGVAIPA